MTQQSYTASKNLGYASYDAKVTLVSVTEPNAAAVTEIVRDVTETMNHYCRRLRLFITSPDPNNSSVVEHDVRFCAMGFELRLYVSFTARRKDLEGAMMRLLAGFDLFRLLEELHARTVLNQEAPKSTLRGGYDPLRFIAGNHDGFSQLSGDHPPLNPPIEAPHPEDIPPIRKGDHNAGAGKGIPQWQQLAPRDLPPIKPNDQINYHLSFGHDHYPIKGTPGSQAEFRDQDINGGGGAGSGQ